MIYIYETIAKDVTKGTDWDNPDSLMGLWSKINRHHRLMAKEMNTSVGLAKLIKNMAANRATYLRLRAEGNPEANKYLAIYNRLATYEL